MSQTHLKNCWEHNYNWIGRDCQGAEEQSSFTVDAQLQTIFLQ
jgi:hypothetical protein